MKKVYSDAFKKSVIEDYYNSPLGVRAIARKYGLPSKNYITNWELYLKKSGLLDEHATKPQKSAGRSKETIVYDDNRTELEKQYEAEILGLKARVEYYEGLARMQPFLKKTKKSES